MLQDHRSYLLKALALASTRRGFCAPNPAVGAVIVKDGAAIADGVHFACGQPHAEILALKGLQGNIGDAILYVTLEPCCHTGRTPPCTEAIIASGIRRVFYGYQDPNPIVAGQGHQQLLNAGIDVQHVSLPEIDQFYQSYTYWQRTRRPWVTAKIAMSLDGKIAGPSGERISITGTALKQQTYRYRYHSDAILTTAKTIIHDNPALNIVFDDNNINHDVNGENKSDTLNDSSAAQAQKEGVLSKRLYILDRQLQLSSEYQIWKNNQPITVFYSSKNTGKLPSDLIDQGVCFKPIDEQDELLKMDAILLSIGADGVHDVWVEAGGCLLKSLIEGEFLQKLLIYSSPKWLGHEAQSAFQEGALTFSQFALKQWHFVGEEAILEMSAD